MSTFYDQFQRCIRHPNQRIVGICSRCLQERLTSLIEPTSPRNPCPSLHTHSHEPPFPSNGRSGHDGHASALSVGNPTVQQPPESSLSSQGGLLNTGSHTHGTVEVVPRSHREALSLRTQMAKHTHHSSDFSDMVARSSNQSIVPHKQTGAKEVHFISHNSVAAEDKDRMLRTQCRERSTTEYDVKQTTSRTTDTLSKKKGSWFSMPSKSKNSLLNPVDNRKSHHASGPSDTNTTSQINSEACRRARLSDLEAIAEINTGDIAHKIEDHIIHETGTTSSWISTFFYRKKWPRSKSNLNNSSGSSVTSTSTDTVRDRMPNGSHRHSPKNSIDAGRLSWDGPRPNFKQLLKRIEARSKQQRADCSPSQSVEYAMGEYTDNGQEITNRAPSLQKSKSVASARSSISFEMPKDLMHTTLSPTLHHGQSNVMVEYDTFYDDRNLRRSRSWGRTWNRALSPLWISRSHRRSKGAYDSPSSTQQYNHHFQAGSVTPSHASFKPSHAGVMSQAHSNLSPSPLRRSNLAPDARIRLAQ